MTNSPILTNMNATTPQSNNFSITNTPQKATVYEKLGSLAEEIQEGIKNLSDASRTELDSEIEILREQSFEQRAPEAEFVSRLYRKYADIADTLKSKTGKTGKTGTGKTGKDVYKESFFHNALLGEVQVPSYIYEGTAEQLAGFAALGNNLFWLRALTCLFCFLTYVIMATVPNIGVALLHPSDAFAVRIRVGTRVGRATPMIGTVAIIT
jgi:hypothetical protein